MTLVFSHILSISTTHPEHYCKSAIEETLDMLDNYERMLVAAARTMHTETAIATMSALDARREEIKLQIAAWCGTTND